MSRTLDIVEALEQVAEAFEACNEPVVFVGGAVLTLYRLPLAPRATEDVDVVVDATIATYGTLISRLQKLGFAPCRHEGAPVCRLEAGQPPLHIDVMPLDVGVLGFTNRWYSEAVQHAVHFQLPSGRSIKSISPLYFIATKLEAFRGRGGGDYGMSHDLGDALLVLASDDSLMKAIFSGRRPVEEYIAQSLRRMYAELDFQDAIAWHFPGTPKGQQLAIHLSDHLKIRCTLS